MKTRIVQDGERQPGPGHIEREPARVTPAAKRRKPPLDTQGRVAVVLASFVALLGVGALAAGGALLWIDSSKTDGSGFYTSSPHRFATAGRAIVSNGLDANTGDVSFLLNGGHIGKLRLSVTPNDGGDVFLGIARQGDVARYLDGVERADVRNIDFDPFGADYIPRAGEATPEPPASTDIWVASTVASTTGTLEWPAEGGDWAVVLMNADGSPAVDADVAAAATVPFIFRLGLGLAIGGFVLALVAAVVVFVASRSRPRGPEVDLVLPRAA